MASTPQFVTTVKTPVVSIANGDGTAYKSVMVAGALGSRLDTLFATNSDNANAYILQLAVQVSGVDYEIGEVSIPAGAGTNNGVAKSVAVLNTTDLPALVSTDGNVMFLGFGAALRARSKTAVAGANTVKLVGVGGDY